METSATPVIALRPVTPDDDALLLAIYRGTREGELALAGWDEPTCAAFVHQQFEAQRTHYQAHWPDARHDLVLCRGTHGTEVAGRLWVDRRPDTIHVLDIALLPAWRGRGIGETCLRRLIEEARASGRAVSIHVEQGNPARNLYERLGFQPEGEPRGIHQFMAWRAEEMSDEEA